MSNRSPAGQSKAFILCVCIEDNPYFASLCANHANYTQFQVPTVELEAKEAESRV